MALVVRLTSDEKHELAEFRKGRRRLQTETRDLERAAAYLARQ